MSISESEISIGGLASSLFVSELSEVGQELFGLVLIASEVLSRADEIRILKSVIDLIGWMIVRSAERTKGPSILDTGSSVEGRRNSQFQVSD